ncbi:MAG: ABC transporter permease [Nitrososphaeria archaeon]
MNILRIFISNAIFSYRAQFSWLNPTMWITMKMILPLSQMAFFVFAAQFLISTGNASSALVAYIAIGNAIQSSSWNTVFSVVNITGHDKWDGTLPLVLASPAPRLPIFVGRAMMHVFDGLTNVAISFFYAVFFFGVDITGADLLALALVVFLTTLAMVGFGLLAGGFSFYFKDPLIFANIFTFILLIFCGVNFPIEKLSEPLQLISYIFPLTYGINASRKVIAGASLFDVSPLVGQMLVVGALSTIIGYFFFRRFEELGRKTGRVESM